MLIYHIIMAKCFDYIWSSSGQPAYKNVNILRNVLHIAAQHSTVETFYSTSLKVGNLFDGQCTDVLYTCTVLEKQTLLKYYLIEN